MKGWRPLRLGGREIPPGSRDYLTIPVAKMLTGADSRLPFHCVRGAKKGPTLSVQALVHGDEPQPVRALRGILNEIDPKKMCGTLLVVPVANPYAFANFSRQSPDQHEETNLWGAFPGNPKGTLTQRYAALLSGELVERADYFLEFHSGGLAGRIQRRVDLDHRVRGRLAAGCRGMARAFSSEGAGIVHGVPKGPASAAGVALARKIPAISVEIGGSYLPETEEALYRKCIEEGFRNLLVHLKMMPGREKRSRLTYFGFSDRAEANPSVGGYLLSRKTRFADLGARVRKGQLLGEVMDPYSLEVVEELRCPAEGVLFFSRCSGPIEAGNKGFAVATRTKRY